MILYLNLEKSQIHLFSMDNNLGFVAHRGEDVWKSNQNAMDADKLMEKQSENWRRAMQHEKKTKWECKELRRN